MVMIVVVTVSMVIVSMVIIVMSIYYTKVNEHETEQAGKRLDLAPSANVVAMATKMPPLVVFPGRPKHIRSIWHTSQLIGVVFVEKNSPNLPTFRCQGNKGRFNNILHGSIESVIPENPLVGTNIFCLSAIQADL